MSDTKYPTIVDIKYSTDNITNDTVLYIYGCVQNSSISAIDAPYYLKLPATLTTASISKYYRLKSNRNNKTGILLSLFLQETFVMPDNLPNTSNTLTVKRKKILKANIHNLE